MEKPQKKRKKRQKKKEAVWTILLSQRVSQSHQKNVALNIFNPQTLQKRERRQYRDSKTQSNALNSFILIFPFPSLFVLLSRQAGHERNASLHAVPPSFTALPCPTTRGHKPAFNTREYPETTTDIGKRYKTKKCESHASRWEKQRARHADVSCFHSVCLF